MTITARQLTWLPKYEYLRIRLEARRNQHWYNVTLPNYSALLPSVTTILGVISKPALVPWAKREALRRVREELTTATVAEITQAMLLDKWGRLEFRPEWIDALIDAASKEPDRIKDEAADYGTQAHHAIDAMLRGGQPEYSPLIQPAIDGFLAWQAQAGIEIVASEIQVFHPTLRYAGSVDWVGWRGDQLIVGDHKTSNGLWPEYGYQVAAYAKAIEELTGIPVAECWGCRYPKAEPKPGEPSFEAKRVANIDAAWDGFCGAKRLWDAQRREMWA